MSAFDILCTERGPGGMGVGMIPVSKMEDRAHKWGMDKENTRVFVYFMRSLDEVFLSWVNRTNAPKGQARPADPEEVAVWGDVDG